MILSQKMKIIQDFANEYSYEILSEMAIFEDF